MLAVAQGQTRTKIETQDIFPPRQVEKASPLTPKKRKIKTLVKRRQKVIKKDIPFPLIPKPILEEEEEEGDEDEDEKDDLPLTKRTHLARATEQE